MTYEKAQGESMDERMLIEAGPVLLANWTGSVLADWGPLDPECESPRQHTVVSRGPLSFPMLWDADDHGWIELDGHHEEPVLYFDLHCVECRDRIRNCIADVELLRSGEGRRPPPPSSNGTRFFYNYDIEAWQLSTDEYAHAVQTYAPPPCAGTANVEIGGLESIDPHDDTRLPDKSRKADALALAAIAREVL